MVPAELRFDALYLNYLINPHHPDAPLVQAGAMRALNWGPRLA